MFQPAMYELAESRRRRRQSQHTIKRPNISRAAVSTTANRRNLQASASALATSPLGAASCASRPFAVCPPRSETAAETRDRRSMKSALLSAGSTAGVCFTAEASCNSSVRSEPKPTTEATPGFRLSRAGMMAAARYKNGDDRSAFMEKQESQATAPWEESADK